MSKDKMHSMDFSSLEIECEELTSTGTINAKDLEINSVAVTATAAELNTLSGITATVAELNAAADVSATSQALTATGAIDLDARYVSLSVASGTYAVTLAAPTAAQVGKTKVIEMIDATGTSVTLALTNVSGGSAATTATFDAAAETLTLIAASDKWIVLDELGVTLS